VEGSTRLLNDVGAEAYSAVLAEHRRLIRAACAAEGCVEIDPQGDAFFFAFPTAPGAVAAAEAFTHALASGLIQVRVGLHTGTPQLTDEGYIGGDVHRAARIAAAGHGGQVLVSVSTRQLVDSVLRDLGEHRFKDLVAPERLSARGVRLPPPRDPLPVQPSRPGESARRSGGRARGAGAAREHDRADHDRLGRVRDLRARGHDRLGGRMLFGIPVTIEPA
jgi:class 3 adenylate cyclase